MHIDAYLCVMSTPTETMAIKTLKIISIQRRSHKLVLMQYFKIWVCTQVPRFVRTDRLFFPISLFVLFPIKGAIRCMYFAIRKIKFIGFNFSIQCIFKKVILYTGWQLISFQSEVGGYFINLHVHMSFGT